MTNRIETLTHSCIIQHGDAAGNSYIHEVDAWEFENGERCPHCDEELASMRDMVAHIYRELTQ